MLHADLINPEYREHYAGQSEPNQQTKSKVIIHLHILCMLLILRSLYVNEAA